MHCQALISQTHGCKDSDLPLSHRLCNFLLTYRSSVHSTTGVRPASFLNREIWTKFDLLRPSPDAHVKGKRSKQKFHHDKHSRTRQFQPGHKVMVRTLCSGGEAPHVPQQNKKGDRIREAYC